MGRVLFIVQQFVGNVANEAATPAFPGLHRDTGGDLLGCVQTAFSPRSYGYLGGKGGGWRA